ncbi:unnamed protein product [Closterium sp. NIES-53]
MKASHIRLESGHLKLTSIQVSASFDFGADRDGVLNRGGSKSSDSAQVVSRASTTPKWTLDYITGAGGAGVGGPSAGGAGAARAGVGGNGDGGAGAAGAGAVDPGLGGAGGTVRPRPRSHRYSQPPHCLLPLLTLSSPAVLLSVVSLRLVLSRLFALLLVLLILVLLLSPARTLWHNEDSSFSLRVPLPAPHESSLPEAPDPESDRARAASPAVSHLFATAVTDPSFESAAASTLDAELLVFAAACRLDYATALVAESVSASPLSVEGECALGTDVLEDRQEDLECLAAAVPRLPSMLLAPEGDPDAPDIPTPRSYAEVIMGPYSSRWQAAMDAEMASWKSTATFVDEVPPRGANIVDGMWIFRMKRPPGSPLAFKAHNVARGFSQRQGVDYFQTFSPTQKMTTLRVLLHVAAQREYELHSLVSSTVFLQSRLHEEIWLRRPPGFTRTFPAGTQWSLRRPVFGLRQEPREWHNTLRTTLATLRFAPSTADPSLFRRTDTSLPPFYILVYVDDLVFDTAHTEALTRSAEDTHLHCPGSFSASASSSPRHSPLLCLPATRSQLHLRTGPTSSMGLVLGGQGQFVLTGHTNASWVNDSATQRSSHDYTFSLGSGSVSWRSTRSSSVLSSSCEAEIYAGAMAAQELR